jgi:hypothetical protein
VRLKPINKYLNPNPYLAQVTTKAFFKGGGEYLTYINSYSRGKEISSDERNLKRK